MWTVEDRNFYGRRGPLQVMCNFYEVQEKSNFSKSYFLFDATVQETKNVRYI